MEKSLIRINKWLYPASWIYGAGVWLRNKLFDWGYYKEQSFDIPVICVGNISVGGTGKTPHTEYLIKLLQKSYQVAVLSRGYKRKSKGFVLAGENTPVQQIGDEPFQMKQKFKNIHMAVDADRCHGIQKLCQESITSNTDVILLDDAFQHRHIKAGLNILLVDYNRMITRDTLLPAGRMREHESGKYRAQIVIITKCPEDMKPVDYGLLKKEMGLFPYQQLYYTTLRYGKLRPLFNGGKEYPMTNIHPSVQILLVTGIATPKKLEDDLSGSISNPIHTLAFSDHHDFTKEDMQNIEQQFNRLPEGKRMIITTEKDAVRMESHPELPETIKTYIYILPVEIAFLQGQQESFNQNILDYVRKNSRNSRLS